MVLLKILIKYLLHASHDSLGHVGAMKLYHFLKRLYYFQGMRKKYTSMLDHATNAKSGICKKTHFINLHKAIAQTPQDHIFIDLLGPYNITSQGNTYALTTVCSLTGYLLTNLRKDKKTMTVVTHLFLDIILKFGFPRMGCYILIMGQNLNLN